MKLKTKDKYFKMIKSGRKLVDYRDAHITFINESFGTKCIRKVVGVKLIPRSKLPDSLKESVLFGDDMIIAFELEKEKKE